MDATVSLSEIVSKKAACAAMAIPRATFYRHQEKNTVEEPPKRPAPPLALSPAERRAILDVSHEQRFWDATPYQMYATLLDEGQYLGSVRTIYRILAANNEVKERRKQVSRPRYKKPELLATAPNEVWSWDITKLLGPVKWSYLDLYVILDIFSRYVVGWMIATRESATLAERLIKETCEKQRIEPGQLTLHADRTPVMTIPTRKLSSRPLNTGPSFQTDLAVSRMLAASARCSSLGTTTSTAIQGLASLLREWSTMDEHKLFSELGKRCCLLLTKSILRGLSESSRRHCWQRLEIDPFTV